MHLVYGVVKVLRCHLILPFLFGAEVTPPTKIFVSALFCVVYLSDNYSRYRNYLAGQLLEKWLRAFQRHQIGPNMTPRPHWGGGVKRNIQENCIYNFHMIKQCKSSHSDKTLDFP